MNRKAIYFNKLKSFIQLGESECRKAKGGWLHGAKNFKKAILCGGHFTDISMPRFHKDPSCPYFICPPNPKFRYSFFNKREGNHYLKTRKHTQQKYRFVEFQLNLCLQKAFNF